MTNPVIVFNCSYNGLSIIQELGSQGIPCVAMDCIRAIGTFSRFARYNKCPDPLKHEEKFIQHLYTLCKNFKSKPVLIPTNDEWAYAISKHKKLLNEVSLPCVADFQTIRTLIIKDLFYKIGQTKQYLTPVTWQLSDVDQIIFPVVAKPKYRTVSSNNKSTDLFSFLERNRLTVIQNRSELDAFIEKAKQYRNYFILQEYVRGFSDSMYTIGIYANKASEIKALFSGRKIRGYPYDIGDNIVGQSESVPKHLIENTERIVKDLNYTGIAEFEYKKDVITGEYRLIEVNPRAWSWIGITPSCGINIPQIAYNDMCGQHFEPQLRQDKHPVRYVKIYQDFVNCLFRYRFSYPKWTMSLKKWLRETKKHKTVYAEFNKKDWLVSLMSIAYVAAKIIKKK